jgi:hypothetical protein
LFGFVDPAWPRGLPRRVDEADGRRKGAIRGLVPPGVLSVAWSHLGCYPWPGPTWGAIRGLVPPWPRSHLGDGSGRIEWSREQPPPRRPSPHAPRTHPRTHARTAPRTTHRTTHHAPHHARPHARTPVAGAAPSSRRGSPNIMISLGGVFQHASPVCSLKHREGSGLGGGGCLRRPNSRRPQPSHLSVSWPWPCMVTSSADRSGRQPGDRYGSIGQNP